MKKNKDNQDPEQSIDLVGKAKENKKMLIGGTIAVLVVAAAIIAFVMWSQKREAKSAEAIGMADIELNDSTALAMYKEVAEMGGTSAERAKIEVAIRLYNKAITANDSTSAALYEETIKYLDDASVKSDIIAAGACLLKGDAYANLDKLDEALEAYNKALKTVPDNDQIVPFVLVKKANILHEQGKYAEEAEAYKEIADKYPSYGANQQNPLASFNAEQYYQRAKALAEQQEKK